MTVSYKNQVGVIIPSIGRSLKSLIEDWRCTIDTVSISKYSNMWITITYKEDILSIEYNPASRVVSNYKVVSSPDFFIINTGGSSLNLDRVVDKFVKYKDNEEKNMKIKFTFGDTVAIDLIQNTYGFYIYTSKKKVTSPIEFFSIKDAILFFSELLPVEVYDREESSLTFAVNIEYKNVSIAFFMFDEDKTKTGWVDYTPENKGFNEYLRAKRKDEDSIDDTIKHFINFVDSKKKEEEDSKLEINSKTYLIKYDEGNKEYYTSLTHNLKITGKSIDEVKDNIREIYKVFGGDN